MNEIKECPFCDSKSVAPAEVWGKHFVKCNYCGANGPETHTVEDAILRWNVAENQLEAKDAKIVRTHNLWISDVKRLQERVAASNNEIEQLHKERDGLEESNDRLKELIDICNSMWNNTIQERNKMERDYDNEHNRANKLESEIEPLRNKVEVLNKNLVETTDRAMVAEVQRDEAREWARRLYQEREDELKMVKLINDTFRNASDLEQLRKERDEVRQVAPCE